VTEGHVPDAVFAETRAQFTEAEIAGLLTAVIAINAWNRVAVSQRLEAGSYVSPHAAWSPSLPESAVA